MGILHHSVTGLIRLVMSTLCRIEGGELRKVPRMGPAIVVINHINFLEIPVIYTRLMPRRLAAMVKAETWKNPILGFLGSLWNGIPLSRGVVDRKAFSLAREALENKEILFVAPEGTRSGSGKLRRGSPGVTMLAADSGVPIFPVGHFGGEGFWNNFKTFRRTDFHIKVGAPFFVETRGVPLDRSARRRIVDEIMHRIAELLPDSYRGYYGEFNADDSGYRFLRFPSL